LILGFEESLFEWIIEDEALATKCWKNFFLIHAKSIKLLLIKEPIERAMMNGSQV
jgi:hypothetical protein